MSEPSRKDRRIRRGATWTLAFAIVAAACGAWLHRDFGTTWDDPFHARVGALALRYFREGFALEVIATIESFGTARIYGPLHDLVPAVIREFTGHGDAVDPSLFELRHAWNFAFALLLVPAIALVTRRVASPALPVFACIALFAQPRFFGDAFLNSIDTSFAVAMAWLHVALLRSLRMGAPRRVDFALLGGALGFVLIERPGALPLGLVLVILTFALRDLLRRKQAGEGETGFLFGVCVAFAIAWVLMILPWPSAHFEPLMKPFEAMSASVRFVESYPVLHDGAYVSSSELPRSHVPWMFLITTPLPTLALWAIGLFVTAGRIMRAPRGRSRHALFVALLWLGVPFVGIVVARPNVYDGIRHFLFVLPAVAIFAGLGAVRVASLASRFLGRIGGHACALVLLLLPVIDCVRLHPYEYVFFNSLVGGVEGASGRYDTEYFATSYREGMALVNERARREPARTFRVAVGGSELMLPGVIAAAARNVEVVLVRPDRPNPSALPNDIDFYLGLARYRLEQRPFEDSPVIATIGRDGAIFAVLRGHEQR